MKKSKYFTKALVDTVCAGEISLNMSEFEKPVRLILPCRVKGRLFPDQKSFRQTPKGPALEEDFAPNENESVFEGVTTGFNNSFTPTLEIITPNDEIRQIPVGLIKKISSILLSSEEVLRIIMRMLKIKYATFKTSF